MVINAEGCKSYRLDLRGPAEQKLEPKHICAGKSEGISHCFAKGPRPHLIILDTSIDCNQ